MKVTKEEAARVIERFLDGSAKEWDWDDFISIPIKDNPFLEAVRLRCAGLREEYPPTNPHEYCGPQGEAWLREILSELRK